MKRVHHAHLPVAASTHPGMSGKKNEDRFAVNTFQLSGDDRTPSLLAVLCDGIGGHRAGEVAAEIAVNSITHHVALSDASQPLNILKDAISLASHQIFVQSQQDPRRHGMGATCAVVWIIDHSVYTATVGDSRIYWMHNGQIQQLSKDHTWLREALDYGLITPEEAVNHPNAHIIRRYLGAPEAPEVDLRLYLTGEEDDTQALANQGFVLQPGDRLLLCSDGLSDLVDPDEIQSTFALHPVQTAVERLIALANARGGHDNITLVAIEAPPEPAAPAAPKRSALRLLIVALIAAAVFSLVGVLAYLGYLWLGSRTVHVATATGTPPSVLTSFPEDLIPAAATPPPPITPTETAPPRRTLETNASGFPAPTIALPPAGPQTPVEPAAP